MRAPSYPYDNSQTESSMKPLNAEAVYLAGHESLGDVTAGWP